MSARKKGGNEMHVLTKGFIATYYLDFFFLLWSRLWLMIKHSNQFHISKIALALFCWCIATCPYKFTRIWGKFGLWFDTTFTYLMVSRASTTNWILWFTSCYMLKGFYGEQSLWNLFEARQTIKQGICLPNKTKQKHFEKSLGAGAALTGWGASWGRS